MTIVINASTVAYGGGLSVTLNLLKVFSSINNHKILVFIPSLDISLPTNNLEYITVPSILLKRIFRIILDYYWLPKKIYTINPKVVLTLGNVPLPLKDYHQIHYFQNAFLVCNSFTEFNLSFKNRIIHYLRGKIYQRRIKYTHKIIAQTSLLKKEIASKFHFPSENIIVLPNTITSFKQNALKVYPLFNTDPKRTNILVLSRYYPHKNLEILLEVAFLFRKYNKKYTLIFTINEKQGAKAKKLINKIQNTNDKTIINIGEIHPDNVIGLYKHIDALLLPSLIESFSSTYVDAMHMLKPVLTSDRLFAREILKDAGWYFNPHSAEDIYNVIDQCFSNETERKIKIKKGYNIVNKYPDWNHIANELLKIVSS